MESKKGETILSLLDLREQINNLGRFKGRAAIIKKNKTLTTFLKRYKVEDSLCNKILKECTQDFEVARDEF